MKLYYSPGACSLSPHIVLAESGLPYEIERVDLGQKKTETGGDYRAVNAKGSVPALRLADGSVLTEGAVIVQYVADQCPEAKLVAPAGTMERYRTQEWLNYVGSEIHKGFSPLFNPKLSDDAKEVLKGVLFGRFDWLESQLDGKSYLLGDAFTVVDAYLFTVLGWTKRFGGLSKWPKLDAYVARVAARPAVQKAMREEGLIS